MEFVNIFRLTLRIKMTIPFAKADLFSHHRIYFFQCFFCGMFGMIVKVWRLAIQTKIFSDIPRKFGSQNWMKSKRLHNGTKFHKYGHLVER